MERGRAPETDGSMFELVETEVLDPFADGLPVGVRTGMRRTRDARSEDNGISPRKASSRHTKFVSFRSTWFVVHPKEDWSGCLNYAD
mgnify:CR=1 FL=1